MRAVLISIQPYWVFLIVAKAMGWNIDKEKTFEVRKNYPKANDWDKTVKIYCSKDKKSFEKIPKEYQPLMQQFLGKVIGEFVCDGIITDRTFGHNALFYMLACMDYAEVAAYCVNKEMYCWHISDLVIYDKPKELWQFKRVKKNNTYKEWLKHDSMYLQRPPQSWCYVEVLL